MRTAPILPLLVLLATPLLPGPAIGGEGGDPPPPAPGPAPAPAPAPVPAPAPAPPPSPSPAPAEAPPSAPLPLADLDILLQRAQQNLRLHGLSFVPSYLQLAVRDYRAAVRGLPPEADSDRRFSALFGLAFALARSPLPSEPAEAEALARETFGLLEKAAALPSEPPGTYSAHPGLWIVDGMMREQVEDYASAEKQVTRGLALLEQPGSMQPWQVDQLRLFGLLARGRALMKPPLNAEHLALKDFQEALARTEEAAKDPLAPRLSRMRPAVLTHLAAAYQGLDYFEDAERVLADLVRTDPGSAVHLYNMALVKATQQKYAEALAWYRRAAEADRTDPNPRIKIAFILLRYPEPGKEPATAEAVREGDAYLRLKGGEPGPEYHALRGEAAFLCGEMREAESWFRRVLAADPDCRIALQRMMNILGQKEDPTDSVRKELEEIRKRLQDSVQKDTEGPGMDNRKKRKDLTFC